MIQLKTLALITFFISSSTMAALAPKEEAKTNIDSVQDKLNTQAVMDILKKHKIKKDQLGIAVHDIKTNKAVFNYREQTPHIPASVTKLFTVFYALNVLGPEATFKTRLAYDGEIKDNVLHGNLYLIGGGDPYLTNEKILNLVMHMYEMGIYRVKGQFLFDESLFPIFEKISLVGLEDHTYNSSVSALSSDFNRIRIIRGKNKKFETLPKLSFIEIDETKEALGPGEKFQRDYLVSINHPKQSDKNGPNITERWFGSKKQRYASIEEVPVRNPGAYTAYMLDFYARKFGIILPPPESALAPKKIKTIMSVESPSLLEIGKLALYYSNNLIAESLLFHAANNLSQQGVSNLIDGARIMEQWIKKKYPELDSKSLKLQNGSGLSSANIVSAEGLTSFLQMINKAKFADRYFWSILPASAHSGFLRKRFVNNRTGLSIWAKTGSLDYVNNIAGYFFSRNGQRFSFALMFQDLDGRKVVDGPNSKKAEKYRQEAQRWRRRTQKAIEEILEYLVQEL